MTQPPGAVGGISYEDAYRLHANELAKLAYLMTGSVIAAEDIVHDVFVRAERSWPAVQNPGAYLRRGVIHACRDRGRESARRGAREERAARVGSRESELSRDLAEWRDVLLKLPERQRAVVVLRYFEGLGDDRIAELLACREATVRSSARRALKSLREVLGHAD